MQTTPKHCDLRGFGHLSAKKTVQRCSNIDLNKQLIPFSVFVPPWRPGPGPPKPQTPTSRILQRAPRFFKAGCVLLYLLWPASWSCSWCCFWLLVRFLFACFLCFRSSCFSSSPCSSLSALAACDTFSDTLPFAVGRGRRSSFRLLVIAHIDDHYSFIVATDTKRHHQSWQTAALPSVSASGTGYLESAMKCLM